MTEAMQAPGVGLGTLGLSESAVDAVATAIELGCCLIDTGEHYSNLELIGEGLKKGRQKGAQGGSSPFLIIKLSGIPSGEYLQVRKRVSEMLAKLGVESGDLCLCHWPGLCNFDPTDKTPLTSPSDFSGKASSWQEFCENIEPAWKNMRQLQAEGLVKEVGVSNFYAHHLQELAKRSADSSVPFANEIFIDATNQEEDFVADMQRAGIKVLAYRPVAYKPFSDGVQRVADRHKCSPQTIVLSWLLRRGVWPLVKCRAGHIQENLSAPAVLKDALTKEDLDEIRRGEVGLRLSAEWFAKIWSAHNETPGVVSEEDVQMLVGMGVDQEKARACLKTCGGNVDEAMDAAFS